MARDFDDREWKQGPGGFGTRGTPGAEVRTVWNGPEIWLRRDIFIPDAEAGADPSDSACCSTTTRTPRSTSTACSRPAPEATPSDYQPVRIRPEALKALKPGKNVLAVHCRQTSGGQYIDVGLGRLEPAAP